MDYIFANIVFSFSLLFSSVVGATTPTPIAAISYENVSGLLLIEASIDGEVGNFIFDTGANHIILNKKTQDNFERSQVNTLYGLSDVSISKVETLIIDELTFENIHVQNLDLSSLENITGKPIAGIIGANIFNSKIIHIDNVGKTIKLYPSLKRHSILEKVSCPFTIENDIPIVKISIQGKEYNFALDSGATVSMISNNIYEENKDWITRVQKKINLSTVSSTNQVENVFAISDCILGNFKIKNLECGSENFNQINTSFDNSLSGVLSINQLDFRNILIDYNEMVIYWIK